jgi:hypothetical protein
MTDETAKREQEPLDPEAVTEILDAIPGAYEHAEEGRAQAGAAGIPLDNI